MERRFEICNNYTKDVLMDFAKFHYKHGKFNLLYFRCGGIFILGIFLVFYALHPEVDLGELLSSPAWILAVLAIVFSYTAPKTMTKKLYKLIGDMKGLRNTVVFYDDKLAIETINSENNYYYTQLCKCYETPRYFYLYVQENICHIIDKSKFTIGDATGLREFLEREAGVKVIQKK